MHSFKSLSLLAVLFLAVPTLAESPASKSAATKPTGPARFEKTIQAFQAADKKSTLANPTLFVGSSSFTRWKNLPTEFAEFHAINHGFGGSTFPDVLYYFDRIILPSHPAKIVIYEGTNDIASRRTPQQVADDFKTLAALVREKLPDARLYVISVNTAPVRAAFRHKNEAASALIQAHARTDPHFHYIDLSKTLLDAAGNPDEKYYGPDRLHPNEEGYARWTPIIKAALKQP
jgi:lysophospholipase L1-like esterase